MTNHPHLPSKDKAVQRTQKLFPAARMSNERRKVHTIHVSDQTTNV